MATRRTIITCAITGAIHTPTMSDALPLTPEQIVDQAVDAAKAGAAILHLHARDPQTGAPSIDPGLFEQIVPEIQSRCDAVINISTGGSLTSSIAQRIAPALVLQPEMCSLNMGSLNFSFHPLARRYESWKHDWEQAYVAGSEANIFRNTFADIREASEALKPHGIRFEHECYDVGHLYNLKFCMDEGQFEAPVFLQFVMGILGGIGAEIENLMVMKATADRLFRDGYRWSVLGAGNAQMRLATVAAALGGNVRVGLEDSLFIRRGELARTNAQQVAKVRSLIEGLDLAVASPDDARETLALRDAAA
ncbi:3-keto-5-aminohexanoate cleavage protein [Paracoccus thiocyanatus]|uniref:3-keto-5-aminohexanoate cleavage protein n=1 Tax=Paracoccus thiocyanatus TaxID=34006 RepID=A0A3D8PF77_9RHOB|nr:3-keto-5-aminohexanoate cleavage protein [Paracoccus thiocyanatus]RDW14292.1 3-keto-5-aminohexanoate cleavage protein [Paracoccus thiocyanatus]